MTIMSEEYEHICLDDYIQSGEGGTALSYSHKDGKTLYYRTQADGSTSYSAWGHLPIEVLRQHWAVFAKTYYGIDDQEELRKREQAFLPYYAVKMLFIISKIHNGSGAPSDMILSLIRRNLGMVQE